MRGHQTKRRVIIRCRIGHSLVALFHARSQSLHPPPRCCTYHHFPSGKKGDCFANVRVVPQTWRACSQEMRTCYRAQLSAASEGDVALRVSREVMGAWRGASLYPQLPTALASSGVGHLGEFASHTNPNPRQARSQVVLPLIWAAEHFCS